MQEEVNRVLAYIRCSTNEQAESGAGMEAQRSAILAECRRRGWPDPDFFEDAGESGASLDRPGLQAALQEIANGGVDVLVTAKLDRLSRSVQNFAALMAWLTDEVDTRLVVLDVDVDTASPAGALVAHVISATAEWERRVISARTKDGLRAIRVRGGSISRPAVADHPDLADRIRHHREAGMTLQQICDVLNRENVPTLRDGKEWRPSAVASACGYRRRPRRKRSEIPVGKRSGISRKSSAASR